MGQVFEEVNQEFIVTSHVLPKSTAPSITLCRNDQISRMVIIEGNEGYKDFIVMNIKVLAEFV